MADNNIILLIMMDIIEKYMSIYLMLIDLQRKNYTKYLYI